MTSKEFTDYKVFVQFVLKNQLDEYKTLLIDMDNLQSGVIKHYLWLNALLIGGMLSFVNMYFPGIGKLSVFSSVYYAAYVSAVFISSMSFIKLIILLRGFHLDAPAEFYVTKICDSYGEDEKFSVIKAEDKWIHEMDEKINEARKKYSQIGYGIRKINNFTVLAVWIMFVGTVFVFLDRLWI